MSFAIFISTDVDVPRRPSKLPRSMLASLGKLACVGGAIWVHFPSQTMSLVIEPLTSVALPILPLEVALALELPIDEVTYVGIATRIRCLSFSVLDPIDVLALVDLPIDPLILADATHLAILHASRVHVPILHKDCAYSLALSLIVKLTNPHIFIGLLIVSHCTTCSSFCSCAHIAS